MTFLVGLVLTGGFLAWRIVIKLLGKSSWCQVKYIDIVGTERLSEEELLLTAAVEPGTNLVALSLDSVAVRVQSNIAVKDAKVMRQLPNSLIIKVVERQPIAAIATGEIKLVDEEAIVFASVKAGETVDLPMITTAHDCKIEYGFYTAVRLLNELENNYNAVYRNLAEVRICKRGLALRLMSGNAEVVFPCSIAFPLLTMEDICDTTALIDYICDRRCPQLQDAEVRIADSLAVLQRINTDSLVVPYSATAIVLEELNRLICGGNIYDAGLLEDCSVSLETIKMLDEKPVGLDLMHLNRRLLESTLPDLLMEYQLIELDMMLRFDCYLAQKETDLPPDLKYVDLRFSKMVIGGRKSRTFSPN